MKKLLLLSTVLLMTACGNSKPSLEEVEKSISEGLVTAEDAYDKGWVSEEWVVEYNEKIQSQSIPAINKVQSNAIGEFETITITGENFNSNELKDVTYFAFINPNTEEGKSAYEVIQNSYDEVIEKSGDVLYVITSEENVELLNDAKFTAVMYNENMKNAMDKYAEMVLLDGFSGSCNVKGSFPFTWSASVDTEYLVNMIEAGNEVVK